MKNWTYKVSFEVNLNSCITEDDAHVAIYKLIKEDIANEGDVFPEVNFELLEEEEEEYNTEEDDGIEELDFQEAVWKIAQ